MQAWKCNRTEETRIRFHTCDVNILVFPFTQSSSLLITLELMKSQNLMLPLTVSDNVSERPQHAMGAVSGIRHGSFCLPLCFSGLPGFQGTLRNGPNSFRLMYVLLVPPIYSILLVCLGTLVGRRKYFTKVALRMWWRISPASVVSKLQ